MRWLLMQPNPEAVFPSVNEKWRKHAEKRFASPFTGSNFDRIDVDPMMLSHAALITGYTINDFYTNPALGASCVANASEMYDLLPVTHWYFSLPWVAELGAEIEFKPFLPPVVKEATIKDPEGVDKLEVPDLKEMENGWTGSRMIEAQDYVQNHLPKMFIPMTYTSDLTGGGAQLCGIADFIMWTLTEPDACKKLVSKYTEVAVNGAELMANRYGMAMISTGSVLANNDIFSDATVNELSIKYLNSFVNSALRKGAGPQVLYHLCGNHETDYKLFRDAVPYTMMTIIPHRLHGPGGVPVRRPHEGVRGPGHHHGLGGHQDHDPAQPQEGLRAGQGAAHQRQGEQVRIYPRHGLRTAS